MTHSTGDPFIDVQYCRKDLLYITQDVINWREKEFLTSALISHLKGSPFYWSEKIILQAMREEHFAGVV